MKKLGKFIFGTLSLASLAAGAYYVYKNFIKKDYSDDFDDLEDEFDDFDEFDIEEEEDDISETREYVSIQIDQDDTEAPDKVNITSDDTAEVSDDAAVDTNTTENNQ